MYESRFKTLRHIETVRNYLNLCVRELLYRQELHDQSKLQSPEVEVFDEYTTRLKDMEYDSLEYRQCLKEMKPAIDHHVSVNRHHPEYFDGQYTCDCGHRLGPDERGVVADECSRCGKHLRDSTILGSGIRGMNLIDLLEMIVDWHASSMRGKNGNLLESVRINQKRFGYSDELAEILTNTASWLIESDAYHHADES